jgi:1-acyl-sn-glycerol-3-phosphate acyltransferase
VKLADFILIYFFPFLKIGSTNKLIDKIGHHKNVDFVVAACKELNITTEFTGLDNLPKTGAATIVTNHPGGADILSLVSTLGEIRPDIIILANELICIPAIEDIVIPIKIIGNKKVDEALIHKAYQDGRLVVFFAAGKNSRYNKQGELKDRKWRISFLDFAQQYKTPINIVRIIGQNSPLFYKVSDIREKYSFLKNIPLENMFQLRELTRPSKMKLFLSTSFHYTKEDDSKQDKRRKADILYNFLYEMDENNLEFNQPL